MPLDIGGLFKKGGAKLIEVVGDALDKNITNKEERDAAKLAFSQEANRHLEAIGDDFNKQLELILQDRQSAREMFKANSTLQKVYAFVFLGAYVCLSGVMIYMIYHIAAVDVKIPEWGIGFVSTIWGAMSTKVGTVTDFLFGSSMPGDKK